MPSYNELPQGSGKWELLWTNPNPNSAINSPITVQMDMTPYEKVFVSMKVSYNTTNPPALIEHSSQSTNWLSLHTTNDT